MQDAHQPYLYANRNGEKCLYYCYANKPLTLTYGNSYQIKPWKIYHKNYATGEIRIVRTPKYIKELGDVVVECNPHVYNNSTLYYIAGTITSKSSPIQYHLCSIDILKDERLKNHRVLKQAFTGTVIAGKIIYNNTDFTGCLIVHDIKGKTDQIVDWSHHDIVNVVKIAQIYASKKILVTCQMEAGRELRYKTFITDENLNIVREITNNAGESIYKSSIYYKDLIYAVKTNAGPIEPRSLVEESNSALVLDLI